MKRDVSAHGLQGRPEGIPSRHGTIGCGMPKPIFLPPYCHCRERSPHRVFVAVVAVLAVRPPLPLSTPSAVPHRVLTTVVAVATVGFPASGRLSFLLRRIRNTLGRKGLCFSPAATPNTCGVARLLSSDVFVGSISIPCEIFVNGRVSWWFHVDVLSLIGVPSASPHVLFLSVALLPPLRVVSKWS